MSEEENMPFYSCENGIEESAKPNWEDKVIIEIEKEDDTLTKKVITFDTFMRGELSEETLVGVKKGYDKMVVQKFPSTEGTFRGGIEVEEKGKMQTIFEKLRIGCTAYFCQSISFTFSFLVCEFKDVPHLGAYLEAKVYGTLGKVPKSMCFEG